MFEQRVGLPPQEILASIPNELLPLNNYSAISHTYSRYKKLLGIAQLPLLGLPILHGFVTKKIDENILMYLREWMRIYKMERLTLRFDSINPEDNKRLMTSNPTLEDLWHMRLLLSDSMIAIIMADNNRFCQGYSVLTAFGTDHLVCEIVGPGFDAGDLTRGQTVPHERFVIYNKPKDDDAYKDLSLIDIAEHSIISQNEYLYSVDIRYSKIYSILQKGLGYAVKTSTLSSMQKKEVEDFLIKQNACALFQKYYVPIGFHRLQEVYRFVSELNQLYQDVVARKVAAASFLKSGLVFWDIFGGDKYFDR